MPRAVAAAVLLMVAGGAAVLATGLAVNLDRVTALLTTLDAGIVGNIGLLLAQLAYAPNAIIWSACYALGPGFTLGGSSIVSPAATELGALPSIPLLAAVPDVGPGGVSHLWWLALGVAAGAVAATLVVLARPSARFDETDPGRGAGRGSGGLRVHRRRLVDQWRPGLRPAGRTRSPARPGVGDGDVHDGVVRSDLRVAARSVEPASPTTAIGELPTCSRRPGRRMPTRRR